MALKLICVLVAVGICSANPDPYIDIFPPKWKPGDVMPTTDLSDINSALNDVIKAGSSFEARRCAVAIANAGDKNLNNAGWYIAAGELHTPLSPIIKPGHTGLSLMVKQFLSFEGVNGIMTYDINGTQFQLAVMWAVPYYSNMYKTYFNMKIYPKDVPASKDMFNQMYNKAGPWESTGWQERYEYGIKMYGSLADRSDVKVIIYIDSSAYNPDIGPSYHAWCESWGVLWKNCRRECSPFGNCWTSQTCSNDADCNGQIECSEKCTK